MRTSECAFCEGDRMRGKGCWGAFANEGERVLGALCKRGGEGVGGAFPNEGERVLGETCKGKLLRVRIEWGIRWYVILEDAMLYLDDTAD